MFQDLTEAPSQPHSVTVIDPRAPQEAASEHGQLTVRITFNSGPIGFALS